MDRPGRCDGDGKWNSYAPSAGLGGGRYPPGQLVPGEVLRETVVYASRRKR